MVVALGPSDWALRLVPFIAGVSVVLLSVVVARRELTSTVGRLTFVGLVSLSPVLIYYSSEFKQYSSDALAAIAIFVAFSSRSSPYGTLLLAGTGFVALVCSLPAIFVAAPCGIPPSVRGRALASVQAAYYSSGLAWLAGAALHGAYISQAGTHHEFMMAWWREHDGFPHSPPNSVADLLWYPTALLSFIYMAFKTQAVAVPGSNEALSDPAGLALAIAFAASLALAFIRRRPTDLLAAAAILLTLIAAAFQIYPFSSRLLLFLVPLAFFTMASAIDMVIELYWVTSSVCALLLFRVMAPVALEVLVEPRAPLATNFKEALHIVAQNSISGDALTIEPWSGRVFEFYRRFDAPKLPTFKVDNGEAAYSMLERAKSEGYHRIWYLEIVPR